MIKNKFLIPTETQNKRTENLSFLSALEMIEKINYEDGLVSKAVLSAKKEIASVVESAAKSFLNNKKIIFIGAGTSGRLGVLEAAECPPTFGTKPWQIIAIMAGGPGAVFKSVEGAEDDALQGKKDILKKVKKGDIVFGIAASGLTPYVLSALEAAKKAGAKTALITCNTAVKKRTADIVVILPTGPEALQGSTRMKAGTATKMALNMITTSTMVLCAKVYKNFMVDVQATNEKLKARAARLVATVGHTDEETSKALLKKTKFNVKTAIVMARRGLDVKNAQALIKKHKGFLSKILNE